MILNKATAGTTESSDVLITVEPNDSTEIHIQSKVYEIFGRQIRETIEVVLKERNISNVKIMVQDQAALDYTIKARLNTALDRSLGIENKKWSEVNE